MHFLAILTLIFAFSIKGCFCLFFCLLKKLEFHFPKGDPRQIFFSENWSKSVFWPLKWNGQYSCLVLYKAEIVSVFPLGILLTEFHHSVQWCIKFGMVHFLV